MNQDLHTLKVTVISPNESMLAVTQLRKFHIHIITYSALPVQTGQFSELRLLELPITRTIFVGPFEFKSSKFDCIYIYIFIWYLSPLKFVNLVPVGGDVYSTQLNVIKFVSYLKQVFSRYSSFIHQ